MSQINYRIPNYDNLMDLWQRGDLTDEEALKQLSYYLNLLDEQLEPLEEAEKVVRQHTETVVRSHLASDSSKNKIVLEGFGTFQIIERKPRGATYNKAALDKVLLELFQRGGVYQEVAQMITEQCLERTDDEGEITSHLRITKERERPSKKRKPSASSAKKGGAFNDD